MCSSYSLKKVRFILCAASNKTKEEDSFKFKALFLKRMIHIP